MIKTETQWTAQFGSLAAAFEDGKKAKNCENGVSYQGYLKGFLYTVSSERLAYRMMDIMERTVRLHPMYADCRMDHVLCGISYRMDYEWQPLFFRADGTYRERSVRSMLSDTANVFV